MQAFERTHDTPYPPREARVASRARWDAFARRLREHLRLSLGLTPSLPEPPLRALRAEAYRGDGYRIERFALETLPGFYLTGSLFVPDAPADTRAPAMLQPHGHFEQGRLNEADVLRAVALAQAGVYVLSYDMVGYNDQFQLPHWGAEPLEWRRWGFSRAGLQTWNSLCAFEWLRQQRAIDPQRIGCSGISGGGTQTFLLSALEPRLSCAAPVKMVSSVMQGGCICENAPLLRLFAGNPEIAGLTAPRPMLLISDAGDWTRDNPDVVAPYLKHVYGLFHAEGQFVHAHFSEGHQWGAEPRRALLRMDCPRVATAAHAARPRPALGEPCACAARVGRRATQAERRADGRCRAAPVPAAGRRVGCPLAAHAPIRGGGAYRAAQHAGAGARRGRPRRPRAPTHGKVCCPVAATLALWSRWARQAHAVGNGTATPSCACPNCRAPRPRPTTPTSRPTT
jgi:hypothetical protein